MNLTSSRLENISSIILIFLFLIIFSYFKFFNLHTEKPRIIGYADCQQRVNDALNLIKEKSKEYDDFVNGNIGIIKCVEKGSGVFVWKKPPILNLGEDTYKVDKEWLAGSIIHDACHVVQYKNSRSYIGESAESECLDIQLDFLKTINADNKYIEIVQNSLKTKYWEIPYEQRSW
jgi:hypothetical protein